MRTKIQQYVIAYPEDTDRVERAVGRSVRLDHAEHTVQLPADEEDDEQVVRIPEPLETSTATLLHGIPNHDTESGSHDPSSCTRTGSKVGKEESHDSLAGVLRIRVNHGEFSKVDHVSTNMDSTTDDNRPGSCLVESDVLVEWNDIIEGCATKERDEVTADREKDESNVNVEDQSSRTGNS